MLTTPGKALCKRFEQRHHQEHAVLGGLEDAGVAHEDGGQDNTKRFVQWIIEGAEAQHDAEGLTNLGEHA